MASLAVIGSIFMYNRMRSIESEVNWKSQHLDDLITKLEKQTGGSSSKGNSNSSMIDAKISSV